MDQKTKVYIFIGAAVLILFLLFWYEFKKKAEGSTRDEQVYVEMPDADVKEVTTSKSHAYATFTDEDKNQDIEDYWTQCMKEEEQKKEKKAEGIITPSNSSGGYSTPSRSTPTYTNPYRETAQEREQRHQRRREEAIEMAERMRDSEGAAPQEKDQAPEETVVIPDAVVTRTSVISQSDDGWGSGISSLGAEPAADTTDERPLKCMFSRQEKLKNGQRVAVILLEEIRINGVVIPKNTHLMGTCRLSNRLEVSFESIEVGGRILPLGYEAYDMDGSKGIYCPDVANVGKTARERGSDIARSSLSSRLGRVAQDVVSTGVSIARSSSGEATVTVPSGYGFFIVKKKDI